jgi:replicative DNA helicase
MIYNKYDKEQRLESTFLLVEKNRDGRCGDIKVNFNQQYIQFTDA